MAIDKNTLVLLHLDDNLADECGHKFENVNVSIDRKNKMVGSGSAYFSNSGKMFCKSPGFEIGGADFTIDFWCKLSSIATYGRIYNICRSKSWIELMGDGSVSATYSVRGYDDSPTTPSWACTNIDFSKWTHFAYVYEHSKKKRTVYIDGKAVLTAEHEIPRDTVKSIELMNNTMAEANRPATGWLDEFRISSCARWTANFTPQKVPYGSESTGGAVR